MNIEKTEYCVFSRTGMIKDNICISLNRKSLKYNPTPKILGLTLDEKLTFSFHINILEQKVSRTVGILRQIKGIAKISSRILIQIYQSLVGSILSYASSICQIGNDSQLKKLDSIQRKGLCLCLDLPSTASVEVLGVAAGVILLHLRREEMAIRDLAKINSFQTHIPIKQLFDNWKQKETPDYIVSPFSKILDQANDMKNLTSIDVNLMEPCFLFNGLLPSMSPPEYWRHLGSSKNRSTEKAESGKQTVLDKIANLPQNSILAFTDGSCINNPGPCGAGAVIFNGNSTIELKKPVSNRASILLGELIAIKLVLGYIDQTQFRSIELLKILSDSQQSIGILTLNWKSQSYFNVIKEIKAKLETLQQSGMRIELEWTPGHAEVQGNEIADRLAKEAAKEAQEQDTAVQTMVTKQDIITASRNSISEKWQHQWENSDRGRSYFKYHPNISEKCRKDFPSKPVFAIITGLRSGFIPLNHYKHLTNQIDSPNCLCGESETVHHYLLQCANYEEEREGFRTELYFTTGSLNLDLDTLLSFGKDDQYNLTRDNILQLLGEFINKTKRFQLCSSFNHL
jgi:ribonuclease HI